MIGSGVDVMCNHVDGGIPSFCFSQHITRMSRCQYYCTNQATCVGYSYITLYLSEDTISSVSCSLHPTDGTCPSGFTFTDKRAAKTMNDLKKSAEKLYTGRWGSCYGKNPGRFILPFERLIYILYN